MDINSKDALFISDNDQTYWAEYSKRRRETARETNYGWVIYRHNRKLNKRYWYQFVFRDKASKDLYDNGRKMTIQYMLDNIKNGNFYK